MEIWKPVPSFENQYHASSLGRIRRVGSGRGSADGHILKQTPMNAGYLLLSLWRDNKGYNRLVHRVIAETFLGPIPEGMEVNHKNGNKRDNRSDNLEYMTRSQNILHGVANHLIPIRGEENPQAKLTTAQVLEIRALHVPGKCGYKQLGKRYGVSWEAIRNIVKRKVWEHV